MLWFYLSLTCAISVAAVDALSKKVLGEIDPITVAWVRLGYCIPFLAVTFLFVRIPKLDETFFAVVLLMLPLEVTALLLYTHALQQSPLSLTVPFLALTPVFLIFTAGLILGERPDASGLAGIVMIAFGSYLLNLGNLRQGWLAPFRSILREGGSWKMIIVAFLYSITSTLGKVAIRHSSPKFFGIVYFPLLAVLVLPFLGRARNGAYRVLFSRKRLFLLIGLFQTIMILTHVTAINLIEVPYMISIKRTSLLFAILFGRLFFGEKKVFERILGGTCMVAGAALIVL
jgi:drug/metabolite transporter (DMT)-like permease